MKLSELYWHRITPLHCLLWPLSLLFGLFITLRRLCYWLDLLSVTSLPVPIIVIDSITTADGGKTPLLLWLVEFLHSRGLRPGIISRGYSDNPGAPMAVTTSSNPDVGGKLLLLAQHCGDACPIWVGHDRVAVAQALLAAHPDCNVLISNDGLQHHRLERDIEIIVIDFNEQSFGNGLMLPAGPLRESLKRLQSTDAIVVNGALNKQIDRLYSAKTFNMELVRDTFYNFLNPDIHATPAQLTVKRLHAVTDTNNERWFFDYLDHARLNVAFHTFTENHLFVEQDLQYPDAEAILMPAEDAVKCREFANETLWVLSVEAQVSGNLRELILKRLST